LESGRQLAIAPDRHNAGTNALAIRAPAEFEPSMGEGSFVRHLAVLAMSGTSYAIVRSRGLGLDIDTQADLDSLLLSRPDWWDLAITLLAGLG
jgi:2-phospho-L-lactate guanylyltransferase